MKPAMKKIICVGDLCADLIIPYGEAKSNISAIKEGEIKSQSVELRSGGTVGNTCRVLGRLGSKPFFITDLCDDSLGRFLRTEMEKDGVDMSYSPLGEYGAMVCIAVLDDNNDRTMFSWVPPGSRYPTFSDESFSEELFSEDAVIFTGGMVLNNDPDSMAAVYRFIKRMKEETDSMFIFDLNTRIESYGLNEIRRYYYDRYIELADIILGSGMEEFGPITGGSDLSDCASRLAKGVRTVIARDGAGPVLIAEPLGKKPESPEEDRNASEDDKGDADAAGKEGLSEAYDIKLESIPVIPVKAVSTVGAGDSFDAAFIHALSRGNGLSDCVRFANRIAGHVISHAGHLDVGPERI